MKWRMNLSSVVRKTDVQFVSSRTQEQRTDVEFFSAKDLSKFYGAESCLVNGGMRHITYSMNIESQWSEKCRTSNDNKKANVRPGTPAEVSTSKVCICFVFVVIDLLARKAIAIFYMSISCQNISWNIGWSTLKRAFICTINARSSTLCFSLFLPFASLYVVLLY